MENQLDYFICLTRLWTLRQIRSLGDIKEELIPEFENVIQWLKATKLSLNTLKTEFMLFGSSKHLKDKTNLIVIGMVDELI